MRWCGGSTAARACRKPRRRPSTGSNGTRTASSGFHPYRPAEIALLVQKGRLTLASNVDDWLATFREIEGVRFVPVDSDVAVQSTRLPGEFHPDSADRMIVALTRHVAAPLVTAGARIIAYRHVRTTW